MQKPLPSLVASGSFGDIGDSSSPNSPMPSRKAVLNDRVALVPLWQQSSSEPTSPTPPHRSLAPTVTPPRIAQSSLRVSSSSLATSTASPLRSRAMASPMMARAMAADNSRELASDLVASMSHQVENLTQQLTATQGQLSAVMKGTPSRPSAILVLCCERRSTGVTIWWCLLLCVWQRATTDL